MLPPPAGPIAHANDAPTPPFSDGAGKTMTIPSLHTVSPRTRQLPPTAEQSSSVSHGMVRRSRQRPVPSYACPSGLLDKAIEQTIGYVPSAAFDAMRKSHVYNRTLLPVIAMLLLLSINPRAVGHPPFASPSQSRGW
jgi:hypothetical protein